jgi:hypothetical protein
LLQRSLVAHIRARRFKHNTVVIATWTARAVRHIDQPGTPSFRSCAACFIAGVLRRRNSCWRSAMACGKAAAPSMAPAREMLRMTNHLVGVAGRCYRPYAEIFRNSPIGSGCKCGE